MRLIENSKIAQFLKVDGIVLFPFIFIRKYEKYYGAERYKILITHEKIHFRQQLEMLVLPFYAFYLFSFLFSLLFSFNPKESYKSIVFEKEARKNEKKEDYLKSRRFWAWLKYFFEQVD